MEDGNKGILKIGEVKTEEKLKTERPLDVCMTINKNDTPPQTLLRKHQEF